MGPAAAVHDQPVGLVRTDLEGYAARLGGLPRWQDLKQTGHRRLLMRPALGCHFRPNEKGDTEGAKSLGVPREEWRAGSVGGGPTRVSNPKFTPVTLSSTGRQSIRHARWLK